MIPALTRRRMIHLSLMGSAARYAVAIAGRAGASEEPDPPRDDVAIDD